MRESSSFSFDRGSVGCLLIHGFRGSPQEMRGLGEFLAGKGVTVLGVRLAGHGDDPREVSKTTWRDWVASAKEGLQELEGRCRRVFVVGLSIGGLIALYLAMQHRTEGAVVMSTPISLKAWQVHLVSILKYFMAWLFCVVSIVELMRYVRANLSRVRVPVLVMQGVKDPHVPPSHARYIHDHVGSEDKGLVWFPNSGHAITLDEERELVWATIYDFIVSRGGI